MAKSGYLPGYAVLRECRPDPRRIAMQVRSSARRLLGIAAATVAAVALVGGVGSLPAAADTPPSARLLFVPTSSGGGAMIRDGSKSSLAIGAGAQTRAGKFSSGTGSDVLVYSPGPTPDFVAHLSNSIPATVTSTSFAVNGSYIPIVGDFTGNGIDDILWYAPGSAVEHLWSFAGDTSHVEIPVSNVSGSYRPTVLDANGDSRDDILWYSPDGSDALWLFGPGGTSKTDKPISAGPGYQVVAGHFGNPGAGQPQDRVVFYNPSGNDWFWTFNTSGGYTSSLLPNVNGNYQLLPGQFFEETYGGLVFYGPGSLPEKEWAFGPGPGGDVAIENDIPPISGTYTAKVGDFDGNGFTDIAFLSGSNATVWNFTFDGTHTQKSFTGLPTSVTTVVVDQH
jgi:hypothetical protein